MVVMAHVINNGLQLIGTGKNPKHDTEFRHSLDTCFKIASDDKRGISDWEKLHVKGLNYLADG